MMVWVVSLSNMELIPHILTLVIKTPVFAVWFGLVVLRPLADPELYP